MARRTDPSPPPFPELIDGVQRSEDGEKPAAGFHMDSAFLPEHYEATPRLNYYITILALSPVVSGGAAFMFAPGSLAAAKAAAAVDAWRVPLLPLSIQQVLAARAVAVLAERLDASDGSGAHTRVDEGLP